ncbi:phage major capsid family protein [Actinomadura nitritigenes]|uniref:phage major capsid family protein n=1 Tax=Actinomadura nitritigenes TaxID=134602 RepID=UPI003D8D26F1
MSRIAAPQRPTWAIDDDAPGTRTLLLAVRSDGTPVYAWAGAAAADIDDWIPIEYSSDVWQRVMLESAIQRYGSPVPMRSKTKSVPRSEGLKVTPGVVYTDDDSENSNYILTARRFIARFTVDEDDLSDAESIIDVITSKEMDWAISYSDVFDHACLGVTGAESNAPADLRPFTSVYKSLRTAQTANPNLGYPADSHYVAWDGTIGIAATPDGTSLYEKLSQTFKKVETSKYWSEADTRVIAHPGFRDALRLATDGNGAPIFRESAGVDSSGRPFDTLFNTQIAWSRGARTHATNTDSPTGNDLLFVGNRRALKVGIRNNAQTLFQPARAQDDTDDAAVKFRVRRGFQLAHPRAWAVMERVAAGS